MIISLESATTVKLIPETEHEKESLSGLWSVLIRCDEDSKVLCPIGAYVPETDEGAFFTVQDQ